jgi:hypothetical protein
MNRCIGYDLEAVRNQWSCSRCSSSNLRPLFWGVSETPEHNSEGRESYDGRLTSNWEGEGMPRLKLRASDKRGAKMVR